jgi:CheY-like chemotaxis protein
MNAISQPSILVADLDTAALAQTVRLLSQFDYSVFSAVCYSSAMSAAMKLDLDLVICDASIQHCQSGQDLIEDVRQLPGRSDVPVVFTSAGQGPDVIRRQHDFGGAYHIKKPLDPIALKEIVEGALWLPHLVHSHINRPHFGMAKVTPITATDSLTVSNPVVF